jgi:hypothetical protein
MTFEEINQALQAAADAPERAKPIWPLSAEAHRAPGEHGR